ncbi:hypothetical protein AB0H43_03180 [Hamadaea sp. NPDC050747]|uniref:hypothetical protein n=1 Tax=Hamadaea sp. NPDC050747 TaxID=3155789 RepID=UPI0033EE84F5
MRPMTPAEALEWLGDLERLIIPAAAVVIVVLALLVRRALKRGKADALATGFAVSIATAFSAEGMYEVATERLHLSSILSLGLFAVAEAAMLSEAIRAKRLHDKAGTLGIHGRAVWTIAVCAGVIVSLNSGSVVEFPIRLGMPILVASLWWLGFQKEATRARIANAISWAISPRRVLVWLRLAEAGEVTVTEAATERLTARMTVAGFRVVSGGRLTARRTRRLKRLALKASDEVVEEAARRIARADAIVALLTPSSRPASAPVPPEDAMPPATPATADAPQTPLFVAADIIPDWAVTRVTVPPAPSTGRPAEETRYLAEALWSECPKRTQEQVAYILGMSRRALRDSGATKPKADAAPALALVAANAAA